MFADISWETAAIGIATVWNPGIILGNVGFELLTSTPLWFGGGYVFGVALRHVGGSAGLRDGPGIPHLAKHGGVGLCLGGPQATPRGRSIKKRSPINVEHG